MAKLKNLYELKTQKKELIEKYRIEHDFEIGYQKYYRFLVDDFYGFLRAKLENLGKSYDDYLEDMETLTLTIPRDRQSMGLILDFIGYNGLGKISFGQDAEGKKMFVIEFGNVSFDYALDCLYEELQRVEYTMKTPEEMHDELENFKTNSSDYLKKKTLKNSLEAAIEDKSTDKYYAFLNAIYGEVVDYYERAQFVCPEPLKSMSIDIFRTDKAFDYILKFIQFYDLGTCSYDGYSLYISFTAPIDQIRDAYTMEMQRLKYFTDENKFKMM